MRDRRAEQGRDRQSTDEIVAKVTLQRTDDEVPDLDGNGRVEIHLGAHALREGLARSRAEDDLDGSPGTRWTSMPRNAMDRSTTIPAMAIRCKT